MAGASLLDHFSALEDPRQVWKVGYPLPEILLVVLCGTMAGAENFVEVERWANRKLGFLRRLLAFRRDVPSHDTLNDVMNALPAVPFSECFTAWVESLREREPDIVAIDGKTSRRARRGAAHPLHLVSAWATRQRLVTGALVTIDAIGCQRDIAKAIRARGADYLLALKDNWPTLAEEVRLFMIALPRPPSKPTRRLTATTAASRPAATTSHTRSAGSQQSGASPASRAFPTSPHSPWSRPRSSATARPPSPGASISRQPLDAKLFARAVRAHWGVENRLHWVMDVVFHDDLMRLRTEHGPANMATIKHAALNLIRAIPDKASLTVRRKTAVWDDDYLFNALT